MNGVRGLSFEGVKAQDFYVPAGRVAFRNTPAEKFHRREVVAMNRRKHPRKGHK